jgi:FixJ family two-component response regulator
LRFLDVRSWRPSNFPLGGDDLVQSLGYEAATFDSAEQFVESGAVAGTSCLITDLQMPGKSGLDLQKQLLADGHHTPVIFVTAFPEDKFKNRAMNAGAVAFLSKPFREDSLIDCVKTALRSTMNHADAWAIARGRER